MERDDGIRQLHVHRHGADQHLHDEERDGGRGAGEYEAVIAVPEPGSDSRTYNEQANAGRGQPVRVLNEDVRLQRRDELTVAAGPVGTSQPGVGRPHGAAQDDQGVSRD